MIDPRIFWTLIGILSFLVFIRAIISIIRGIRYEYLQVSGFALLILSLSLTGSYSYIYYVGSEEIVYLSFSLALALLSVVFILAGTLSSSRQWVSRRGTENLNRFTNLLIFAYVRHPVSLGMMLISISMIFYIHSLLSNLLAGVAFLVFMFSSFEKDTFFKELYGYPYKVYSKTVPRFNFVHGLIKALIVSKKVQDESRSDLLDS
ncbi:MAG: hypothetical protein ACTSSN_09035 [Candidatus Heimdallarchaeaceae archaeon]